MNSDEKTLVIITASFPYGSKEPFLETEITFLANEFTKIFILPRTKPKNIRPFPENVLILDILNSRPAGENKRLFNFKKTFSLLTSGFFWKEIYWIFTKSESSKKIRNIKICFSIGRNVIKNHLRFEQFFFINPQLKTSGIFYSYWFTADTIALSLFKKKGYQFKAIARAHRFDLYEFARKTGYLPFRRFAVKHLTALCPISEDGGDYLKNRFLTAPEKVNLMRLGSMSLSDSASTPTNSQPFFVLSIARFRPVKRVEFIALALKKLADEHPQKIFRWVHVGGGEADLETKTRKIIQNFPKNIETELTGEIPNTEVLKYLRSNSVHLFLNLSSSEGLPVSMMEAQSVGIPILATDVGGVREIVNNDNGCLLHADSSEQEVVAAIAPFLNDNYRIEKSKKSFENWQNKYDAQKNYSGFANWLSKIV